MAGETELLIGGICGGLVGLFILTSYWFYTVPARYAANRKQLDFLTKK